MSDPSPGLALLAGRAFAAMEIVVSEMHSMAEAIMSGDMHKAESAAERIQRQIEDAGTSAAAVQRLAREMRTNIRRVA